MSSRKVHLSLLVDQVTSRVFQKSIFPVLKMICPSSLSSLLCNAPNFFYKPPIVSIYTLDKLEQIKLIISILISNLIPIRVEVTEFIKALFHQLSNCGAVIYFFFIALNWHPASHNPIMLIGFLFDWDAVHPHLLIWWFSLNWFPWILCSMLDPFGKSDSIEHVSTFAAGKSTPSTQILITRAWATLFKQLPDQHYELLQCWLLI